MKKTLKWIGATIWEAFKDAIPSVPIYAAAGSILIMFTWKETLVWDETSVLWTCICLLLAMAYNAFVGHAQGGMGYEMLVSGNINRRSAGDYGEGYHISSHKEVKEYRVWKGFLTGGMIGLFPIVFGVLAGIFLGDKGITTDSVENQSGGMFFLISIFVSGWSLVPFYSMNASGLHVSYYWSCLFAVLPVIVSGIFYIVGAYARRNKNLRLQRIADEKALEESTKVKKINYGGLPGTKPRKRK